MANPKFTEGEWEKINETLDEHLLTTREPFGLPEAREKSVLLGTFNIRKLGEVEKRSPQAWNFLNRICKRFDLFAIQEVQDDLSGIRELKNRLGDQFGLVVSDTTGRTPGSSSGSAERLAFLFKWARIRRTELASDISFDRTSVINMLFENRDQFEETWDEHQGKLDEWEQKNEERKALGKRRLPKPKLRLPMFLTFIRQPHCASFEVVPKECSQEKPYEFLVVNAHLLYGEDPEERRWEFDALIEWLAMRAKSRESTYHENILMMGDCNLEFENIDETRQEIDDWLKGLNARKLKHKTAAKANFPFLDPHPDPHRNPLRTNARQDQTYDQIAIFAHDERLPNYKANEVAGLGPTPDEYDYGVFKYTDLFARALFSKDFAELSNGDKNWIIKRTEHDISDHMPAWFRLPIPGA